MIAFASTAIISLIEKELIKHEPAIQAFIMAELAKLLTNMTDYVNGKLAPIASGENHG